MGGERTPGLLIRQIGSTSRSQHLVSKENVGDRLKPFHPRLRRTSCDIDLEAESAEGGDETKELPDGKVGDAVE